MDRKEEVEEDVGSSPVGVLGLLLPLGLPNRGLSDDSMGAECLYVFSAHACDKTCAQNAAKTGEKRGAETHTKCAVWCGSQYGHVPGPHTHTHTSFGSDD